MAVTTASAGNQFNTTSGSHTVQANLSVGTLIIIIAANTGNVAATAPTDDKGGTYSEVTGAACVKATSLDQMRVWVRDQLMQAIGITTYTHNPGTSNGGGFNVLAFNGLPRPGLAVIRQAAKQDNQAAAGTPTPVFSVAALTGNTVIGAVFNSTSPATMTQRTGYTERIDVGFTVPTTGVETMSRDGGETGTSIAWGSASASEFCACAFELDCTPDIPPELIVAPMRGYRVR